MDQQYVRRSRDPYSLGTWAWDFEFRVSGLEVRVLGFRAKGSVQGLRIRVYVFGIKVQGVGSRLTFPKVSRDLAKPLFGRYVVFTGFWGSMSVSGGYFEVLAHFQS